MKHVPIWAHVWHRRKIKFTPDYQSLRSSHVGVWSYFDSLDWRYKWSVNERVRYCRLNSIAVQNGPYKRLYKTEIDRNTLKHVKLGFYNIVVYFGPIVAIGRWSFVTMPCRFTAVKQMSMSGVSIHHYMIQCETSQCPISRWKQRHKWQRRPGIWTLSTGSIAVARDIRKFCLQ